MSWALLSVLHRVAQGGQEAPEGFEEAYAELRAAGFVDGTAITDAGEAMVRARWLED